LDPVARLRQERVARGDEGFLRDAANGLGELLLERRQARRCCGCIRAGLDELVTCESHLGTAMLDLVAQRQLTSVTFGGELAVALQPRAQPELACAKASEGCECGYEDRHEGDGPYRPPRTDSPTPEAGEKAAAIVSPHASEAASPRQISPGRAPWSGDGQTAARRDRRGRTRRPRRGRGRLPPLRGRRREQRRRRRTR